MLLDRHHHVMPTGGDIDNVCNVSLFYTLYLSNTMKYLIY